MITTPDRIELLKLLPKNAIVAEIGVLDGWFSDQIRLITKPRELHLIDCWEQQDSQLYKDYYNQATKLQEQNWRAVVDKFRPYSEVSIHRAYSIQAAQNFKDEYFDWIYLDANHSYEAVKQDLHAWWPKIKSGGLFLGHDWTPPEMPGCFRMDIIKAVTEFMSTNSLSLEYITDAKVDPFCSWGIRKT